MVGGGEEDDGVGFFPFISEVSSSNVVYLLHSSPSSVHFWNSYRIAFFCTYWSTRPVLLLSNKCYARIWMHQIFLGCDFFAAPVASVSERGFFPGLYTRGQVEWSSKSLCSAASRSLSAANLLTRLQLFCGRKTISVFRRWACLLAFTLDPGVGRPWCWAYPWVQLSCRIHFPSAPRFPRFPQSKPPVASPPTVVWLWMPEAELILVDVWPRLTRLIYCLAIHTQAVQPSYSWAKLSRLVASLMT